MAITVNDFLNADFLGDSFLAVRNYEPVTDRETKEVTAYRLNISIQDVESPFFMEMISVKVKTLTPSVSVASLANNKTTPVILENLNMGQFNGNLWFSCDDVVFVSDRKINIDK